MDANTYINQFYEDLNVKMPQVHYFIYTQLTYLSMNKVPRLVVKCDTKSTSSYAVEIDGFRPSALHLRPNEFRTIGFCQHFCPRDRQLRPSKNQHCRFQGQLRPATRRAHPGDQSSAVSIPCNS